MKKFLSITFLFLSLHAFSASVNYIDAYCFGFEETSSSWWFQHSDYWSVSTVEKNSGSQSMRFICNDASAITETKKVHSSDNISTINLSPGTYTLTMKVFIEDGYTGTGFSCVIKETWISTKIDFSGLENGRWIDVEKTITVTEQVANSRMMLTVSSGQIGNGKFYIDDIAILGEVTENTPLRSSVLSQDVNHLSLDEHYYKAKLKVKVEDGSVMQSFYTIIHEPYTALKWDISTAESNTWVELEQSFHLKEDAVNSVFEIIVPNSNASGTFYLDAISFEEAEPSSIESSKDIGIKLYPNPAQTNIIIESPQATSLFIYDIVGNLHNSKKLTTGTNSIDVAHLKRGIYILKIKTENTYYNEKLILE